MTQGTRARPGAPLRFIERALASQTDECIEWPYATSSQGYGRIWNGAEVAYAHRLVLERTVGPAPAGAVAAHAPLICHNRACVNPRHLRWATPVDNSADSRLDGTQFHSRGERSGKSKLTTPQVLAIRSDPRSHRSIAADYGIGKATVTQIKARTRWAHL